MKIGKTGEKRWLLKGLNKVDKMKTRYFNISWQSNVDGPGWRVVLFLQGCHLRCPWRQSPHSRENRPPLLYFENRCIDRGACIESSFSTSSNGNSGKAVREITRNCTVTCRLAGVFQSRDSRHFSVLSIRVQHGFEQPLQSISKKNAFCKNKVACPQYLSVRVKLPVPNICCYVYS